MAGSGTVAAVSGSVVASAGSGCCVDVGATSAVASYAEPIKAMSLDVEQEHQAMELLKDVLQRHAQFLQEREQNSLAELGTLVCGEGVPPLLPPHLATSAAASSTSCLSPAAAEFSPAPRWGNSPMKRHPLIPASASSISSCGSSG